MGAYRWKTLARAAKPAGSGVGGVLQPRTRTTLQRPHEGTNARPITACRITLRGQVPLFFDAVPIQVCIETNAREQSAGGAFELSHAPLLKLRACDDRARGHCAVLSCYPYSTDSCWWTPFEPLATDSGAVYEAAPGDRHRVSERRLAGRAQNYLGAGAGCEVSWLFGLCCDPPHLTQLLTRSAVAIELLERTHDGSLLRTYGAGCWGSERVELREAVVSQAASLLERCAARALAGPLDFEQWQARPVAEWLREVYLQSLFALNA